MLRSSTSRIRRFRTPFDKVTLDEKTYKRVVADLESQDALHQPSQRWALASLFPDSQAKQISPSFNDMLAPWVGRKGYAIADAEAIDHYRAYWDGRDHLGLLPEYLRDHQAEGISYAPMVADLGTIMDLNFITKYLELGFGEVYILEIGGGYGRLAEGFLTVFEQGVKYVLVDVVPASLCYAYEYLKHNLVDKRIGFYYKGHPFDLSQYDCYVIPTWKFASLNTVKYDVSVNISSMQEMTEEQIKYYLILMDQTVKEGGIVYLLNAKDPPFFTGHYSYPSYWKLEYLQNTPRSYFPNQPVEIFRKTDRDWTIENALIERIYLRGLGKAYHSYHIQSQSKYVKRIESLMRINKRLRAHLEAVRGQNGRLLGLRKVLKEQSAKLRGQLEAVRGQNGRLRRQIDALNDRKGLGKPNHTHDTQIRSKFLKRITSFLNVIK